MSSVCKINALLAGSRCGGDGNARGIRQLASSKGPVRMGIRHREKGIAFPSKIICSFKRIHTRLSLCICMQNKKRVLCAGLR
jgi:hypothetical protein